jgi:hypothetical protein
MVEFDCSCIAALRPVGHIVVLEDTFGIGSVPDQPVQANFELESIVDNWLRLERMLCSC